MLVKRKARKPNKAGQGEMEESEGARKKLLLSTEQTHKSKGTLSLHPSETKTSGRMWTSEMGKKQTFLRRLGVLLAQQTSGFSVRTEVHIMDKDKRS